MNFFAHRPLFSFLVWIIFCGTSCDSTPTLPKPRAYPKVDLPQKSYQDFELEHCPMDFRYPTYAQIIKDELFFDESLENDCWFDISVPKLGAKIHCSYYPINSTYEYDKLLDDAFKLAGKHTIKADYIDEIPIRNKYGTSGFLFALSGPVASPYQFFLTDTTQHFIRGALYFHTQSRPDSLAPVIEFMSEDIDSLLMSFSWK